MTLTNYLEILYGILKFKWYYRLLKNNKACNDTLVKIEEGIDINSKNLDFLNELAVQKVHLTIAKLKEEIMDLVLCNSLEN